MGWDTSQRGEPITWPSRSFGAICEAPSRRMLSAGSGRARSTAVLTTFPYTRMRSRHLIGCWRLRDPATLLPSPRSASAPRSSRSFPRRGRARLERHGFANWYVGPGGRRPFASETVQPVHSLPQAADGAGQLAAICKLIKASVITTRLPRADRDIAADRNDLPDGGQVVRGIADAPSELG